MVSDEFKYDYDLSRLQVVSPRGRNFKMLVTPRYLDHYVDNLYEEFSSALISSQTGGKSLFIDVGAHYGYYSLLVARNNPECDVIALEPVPENYAILQKNIELNSLTNIQAHNIAVSDENGRRSFHITGASDNCGFHGHPRSADIREIEVETARLDRFLDKAKGRNVVVKIDTEGHELRVLEGMEQFLRGHDNIRLLLEFNPKCIINAGYTPVELLRKISGMGFDSYFILDDKKLFYRLDEKAVERWQEYMPDYESGCMNILCIKKNRSLNVCMFSHYTNLVGAERSLLELTSELIADRGAMVTVVVPHDGPLVPKLREAGAAIVTVDYYWWCEWAHMPVDKESELNRLAGGLLNVLNACRDTLSKVAPDVIMTNTMVIPWGMIAACVLDRPHVWFIRELGEIDYNFRFYLPFSDVIQMIVQSSSAVFTTSKAVKDILFSKFKNSAIYPVYSYFDIKPEDLDAGGHNYYARPGAIKLLILGSIIESKGQLEAILAVRELVKRGQDAELVIIGPAHDDNIAKLQDIINQNGLQQYVSIPGWQKSAYAVMSQADVVLVCSRFEAFGRVTAEAMMLKKPVIGTNAGGTAEMIEVGKTGWLYEPGDYRQLADHIEYFIKHKASIAEFGQKGYQFASRTFSRDRFGGEVYRKFSELKGGSNKLNYEYGRFINQLMPYCVNELEAIIGDLNRRMDDLSATLRDRDDQLGWLEPEFRLKEQQLMEQSLLLEASNLKISELEEKDNLLTGRISELQEKDSLLVSRINELQEKDQQLIRRVDELLEKEKLLIRIQNGTLMQAMTKYNLMVGRLLPEGTARRRWYQSVVSWLSGVFHTRN